jgi:hypothetical protein
LIREIKYNLPVRLCAEAVPFLMGCGMINSIYNYTGNDSGHLLGGIVFTAMLFFLWYIMHFSFLPNTKTILTDTDIRQVLIIKIGSWQIVNRVKIIKWNDVDSFERILWAGYYSGYRIFGKSNLGRYSLIVLNSELQTFSEDDRQFIINHLPDYKVAKSARKEIIKSKIFLKD